MAGPTRRRVDWNVIIPGEAQHPTQRPAQAEQHTLVAALNRALRQPSIEHSDQLIREAVEFAREQIGLARVAFFLLDSAENAMLGSWGTGSHGETVDEHHIMFDAGGMDVDVVRAAKQGIRWLVYDDCPRVAHDGGTSRMLSRGWVACTALHASQECIGIIFNDGGEQDQPVDDLMQARLAALAALVAPGLLPLSQSQKALGAEQAKHSPAKQHPVVRQATQLLSQDASLSGEALAAHLEVSPSHLARLFKRATGTTLVSYRNELRLTRVLLHIDADASNLLEACLSAGFGSYAQFHRVFRARFGQSPRDYLGRRKE